MRYPYNSIEQIIIADNSSTDNSLNFIDTLPYKDKIKIIHYQNLQHRDAKGPIPCVQHINIGIDNCRTEWALLTHVDVMWKMDVTTEFHSILNNHPDLFMSGLGGGNPNVPEAIIHDGRDNGVRFHEWLLFINVLKYREYGYSFNCGFNNKIFYDIGAWMYKQAYNSGKVLVPFDTYESHGKHIAHFACGSNIKKQEDSLLAKSILEKEYE
jgi:glycosyltransferase involved in cell wall biosynthesis